jgi:hypothetical protein
VVIRFRAGEEEKSTINEFRMQKGLPHPRKFVLEITTFNGRKKGGVL